MNKATSLTSLLAAALILACAAPSSALLQPPAAAQPPADNIGHDRHTHHHNDKHPTEAPTAARFVTSRKSDIVLPLPIEQDAFTFAVFGDRTGGPVDGVRVLADAVRDTNLIEPDLVMTVGDLINGYNDTPQWLEQMREFKTIMNELRSPWFPVAGNHDVYWRGTEGKKKPPGEHEQNYEMHFGPLWYAFEHKNCWFIAIYSDEGNADTGEKAINKPDSQRMSEEQFAWLKTILSRAKGAEHVFLFLHHPRWLRGNYGDDWDKVHKELVAAGNVTAVFAGHIHRMRYDPKDGIEYVTLATVGGHQEGKLPGVGYLHQYHLITVRKKQVAMAAFPVGEAIDVRELTGTLQEECLKQADNAPVLSAPVTFAADGSVNQRLSITVPNLTTRPIELTLVPDSADSSWIFSPDHAHATVAPGSSSTMEFRIVRLAGNLDQRVRPMELALNTDVLLPGHRYALPEKRLEPKVNIDALPAPAVPASDAAELALALDGDDALAIDSADLTLPDGPFTIECWMRADKFEARTGLICKTESAEFGIFVNDGRPAFNVFLGAAYANAIAPAQMLTPGQWAHVAGVFDGQQVRLYVDGKLVTSTPATGKRKTNKLPLMIGADVTREGSPTSNFVGRLDALHISKSARYTGDSFTPARRARADDSTVLLSNFDGMFGRRAWGQGQDGQRRFIGRAVGSPMLVPAE